MKKLSTKYKDCLYFYDYDVVFRAECEDGKSIIAMAIPDGKLDAEFGNKENCRDYYYMAFQLHEDAEAEYVRGSICLRTAIDHPGTVFFTCDQCFFDGVSDQGPSVEFVHSVRPEERDLPNYGLFEGELFWLSSKGEKVGGCEDATG